MDSQEILVCERHKKKEKSLMQIPSNYYVCMNRYCPNAYSVLCSTCKLQHRDHQMKVLSIQDIGFLIQRLLKLPFKQAGIFIIQSVEILKKVKLINQFTNKIAKNLVQLQKQAIEFISITQNIISEYANCKNSAKELSQIIMQFESKEAFEVFRKKSIQKLNKLDYNMQKDIIMYGNLQIKQKEDSRRKTLTYVKRTIQQVKEYSMKIIQVILNNDDDSEEEQDILQKKKNYQILKSQITAVARLSMQQEEKKNQKNSEPKKPSKKIETTEIEIQTDIQWKEYEKSIKQLQLQVQSANNLLKKSQTENKIKIKTLQKQKQNLFKQKQMIKRQKQKIQKNYDQKCEFFTHYEHRLRDNYQKRNTRYRQREEIIKQLIELIEHQRVESRLSSPQKQNRNVSKNKKS